MSQLNEFIELFESSPAIFETSVAEGFYKFLINEDDQDVVDVVLAYMDAVIEDQDVDQGIEENISLLVSDYILESTMVLTEAVFTQRRQVMSKTGEDAEWERMRELSQAHNRMKAGIKPAHDPGGAYAKLRNN
jgi:S-ribosylhomocysteine lyase LuxS involved in autoinducer biosynthesis